MKVYFVTVEYFPIKWMKGRASDFFLDTAKVNLLIRDKNKKARRMRLKNRYYLGVAEVTGIEVSLIK